MKKADVIIVGSGAAALQLAGCLRKELNVIILTKSSLTTSNSSLAQGGIAAALDPIDHPTFHYQDTLEAGRYHNDPAAVLQLVQQAPSMIKQLMDKGCNLDLHENGIPLLGKEGSHRHHRIVHGGGDQTGRNIIDCLISQIGRNVKVTTQEFVYELLLDKNGACCGVKTKDKSEHLHTYTAPHVVLATGGGGQVYSLTSNSSAATGDGFALGYRAGAELADMEFVQFHPTLIYSNGITGGLVSEAVRGEGAILVNSRNEAIMKGAHPLKDLAPRHIVSQTIFSHMQAGETIYLDVSAVKNFSERFPTISAACQKHEIDLQNGRIPVAPGCHFSMGGIKTDTFGRTSITGLYAIGEVACTGIHGANRLASNSLLEGLVYGQKLASLLNNMEPQLRTGPVAEVKNSARPLSFPDPVELRKRMMKNTGIVRTKHQLLSQIQWLNSFNIDVWTSEDLSRLSRTQMTAGFMLLTAWLITTSALQRTESRGGHYRSDFPEEKENWRNSHVIKQMMKRDETYEYIKA